MFINSRLLFVHHYSLYLIVLFLFPFSAANCFINSRLLFVLSLYLMWILNLRDENGAPRLMKNGSLESQESNWDTNGTNLNYAEVRLLIVFFSPSFETVL